MILVRGMHPFIQDMQKVFEKYYLHVRVSPLVARGNGRTGFFRFSRRTRERENGRTGSPEERSNGRTRFFWFCGKEGTKKADMINVVNLNHVVCT